MTSDYSPLEVKKVQTYVELGFNDDELGLSAGALNEHDGSCIKGNCRKHCERILV